MILALVSGPWSEGENLPPEIREAMIVRERHLQTHVRAILEALDPLDRARQHIEEERLRNLRLANEAEDAENEHNATVYRNIVVGLETARNIIDREVGCSG